MTPPPPPPPETLPTPPFHPIPGLPNFRDLGGYPLASNPNKIIRPGIIYRSAEPSQITPEGIAQLDALGIKTVWDLRSQREFDHEASTRGEEKKRPIREWPGCTRIFAPVFRHEDYSPERIATRFKDYASGSEGFTRAYAAILEAATATATAFPEQGGGEQPYRRILETVLTTTTPPPPLLLHCTAGKDRTGVLCGLLLSVLGVEDEVVAHEYSLTDLGLRSQHERIIGHLEKEEVFKGNPEGARLMVRARRENMLGFLGYVREKYGSVEGCFLETGMVKGKEELERLKGVMVVDLGEGGQQGQGQEVVVVDWRAHRGLVG